MTLFGEHEPSSLSDVGAGKMRGEVSADEDDVVPPTGWCDTDIFKQDDADAIVVHGGLEKPARD